MAPVWIVKYQANRFACYSDGCGLDWIYEPGRACKANDEPRVKNLACSAMLCAGYTGPRPLASGRLAYGTPAHSIPSAISRNLPGTCQNRKTSRAARNALPNLRVPPWGSSGFPTHPKQRSPFWTCPRPKTMGCGFSHVRAAWMVGG